MQSELFSMDIHYFTVKGPNSKRKQTIDFDTFYQTPFGDPNNV